MTEEDRHQESFRGSKWYVQNANPPGIYPNCGRFLEIFAKDPFVPPAPHEMCIPIYTYGPDEKGNRKLEFVGWKMTVSRDKQGRILTGDPGTGGIKVAAYESHTMFPEKTGEVVKHVYVDEKGRKSTVYVSDGSDGSTDFNDID